MKNKFLLFKPDRFFIFLKFSLKISFLGLVIPFLLFSILDFSLKKVDINFYFLFILKWISILLISIYYFYKMLYELSITYKLYADQLVFEVGLFSRTLNFIELYRVKDYSVYQSFTMRIFQIMNIKLLSSDKSFPTLIMSNLKKNELYTTIRNLVENQRKLKGVREFD